MSGKTTFIRSVGLNFITGASLNTCFANSAILPKAKLLSAIRITDDIMSSSSYFFQEVDTLKSISLEMEKGTPCLVLLDEIFKGTNTKERIASAKAVLSYLNQWSGQILVSTHDVELCDLLKNEYELFHFSETITETEIHFDYKLKKGVPEKGNAISILEMNGYPKSLVLEARALVSLN